MRRRQVIRAILEDELLSSDDDLSDVDDGGVQKITVDLDCWRRLGDPTFKKQFRMDRPTFELLIVAVGNHLLAAGRWYRIGKLGLDINLMMVLWILATPDSFRSVSSRFGVSTSTVHDHYKCIIEALREMSANYIRWPTAYEQEIIAENFENMYGYPGVCGCIDGSHINITKPLYQGQRYVDRKANYSIILQGVCDDNMLFRDVYVGQPGSVGDKRTFRRSGLGQRILRDPAGVMETHSLLGDGGYTLIEKVIIPYRDNGALTPRQRIHNYYHARCRSIIERAFGLLKGKWRRLKLLQSYCVEYVVDHITSCAVLHNFIILEGDAFEPDMEPEPDLDDDDVNMRQLWQQAKLDGALRRDFNADYLYRG
ncbi:Protein ANTAGONIST OF LIKE HETEROCHROMATIN PROTEIN 1 [Frankliniella fusca]|uniref:Protein ANTAGONIST OF LIKE HETEROCHROMATIN PROTEIN 1 n=1 Tax=Frankliniella fusca TaxID=407009 RepID=A0AAE1LA69_9NEOP|nr:Protein ANTAGONIST OF LIKE HETEROCHROMATIN PROTEIN 1 [Frankliniella fusca]